MHYSRGRGSDWYWSDLGWSTGSAIINTVALGKLFYFSLPQFFRVENGDE